MAYIVCEDCGCRVYNGLCVNCDEETFIKEQYLMAGESVPIPIAEAAEQQRRRAEARQSNS